MTTPQRTPADRPGVDIANGHTRHLIKEAAKTRIGWYVSAVDGSRRALLYGPLNDELDAESWVEPVRRIARKHDPWAAFYEFGHAKVTVDAGEPLPEGKLNHLVEAAPGGPANL